MWAKPRSAPSVTLEPARRMGPRSESKLFVGQYMGKTPFKKMLVLVVFPILTESTTPPPSAPPYPLRHCELVQTMCSLITARELTVKVFAVSQTWSGQLGVAGSQRWAVMFLVTYAFSTSYVKEPAVAFPEVSTVLTVRAC